MNITTMTKTHYGTDHIYIKDESIAELVQQLTNKKTVSEWDLNALANLGHTILKEDGSSWSIDCWMVIARVRFPGQQLTNISFLVCLSCPPNSRINSMNIDQMIDTIQRLDSTLEYLKDVFENIDNFRKEHDSEEYDALIEEYPFLEYIFESLEDVRYEIEKAD